MGADRAHSLRGKLSEKHPFLDMTQGHDEDMTELENVTPQRNKICSHITLTCKQIVLNGLYLHVSSLRRMPYV